MDVKILCPGITSKRLTGITERKHSRGKRQEKLSDGLTKWLNVGQMTDTLKVTRD